MGEIPVVRGDFRREWGREVCAENILTKKAVPPSRTPRSLRRVVHTLPRAPGRRKRELNRTGVRLSARREPVLWERSLPWTRANSLPRAGGTAAVFRSKRSGRAGLTSRMRSAEARVLACVLGGVVLLAALHAWVMVDRTHRVSAFGDDAAIAALPHRLVRPEFTADAHVWIRLAESVAAGEQFRVRHTRIDNAPAGREVHWNSAYAWWLALAGEARRAVTGEPRTHAMESAALWANLPLFLAGVGGLAWWTRRRAGAVAAAVVTLAVFGNRFLYGGFWPGNTDHHGLIGMVLVAMGLGAFWMRGGLVGAGDAAGAESARGAARWSGLWGGVGLWLSAATTVPAIAGVTVASALAAWAVRRHAGAAMVFLPQIWRTWGRWGAATSGVLYLLEYFPAHLGWRLEVNHPLYALAWWGGAELGAALLSFAVRGAVEEPRRRRWTLALAGAAVLAPAVAVLVGGSAVFTPLDGFVAGVHGMILEFLPIGPRWAIGGWSENYEVLVVVPAFLVAGGWALARGRADRWAVWFAVTLLLLAEALALWQARWTLLTVVGQVMLLLAILPHASEVDRRARVFVSLALLGLLAVPDLAARGWDLLRRADGDATSVHAEQLSLRSAAAAIRRDSPQGDVVVWSGPNTAHDVAFYGNFRALGTLYWENAAGLRAMAAIAAAPEDEAARLMRNAGVTHVVLTAGDDVLLDVARVLRPEQSEAEWRHSFGRQLLDGQRLPWWLEPVWPRMGDALASRVRVWRVNFQAPSADALRQLEKTLVMATAAERYRLLTQTGAALQQGGRRGEAKGYLLRALNEGVTDLEAALRLGWILATAPESDVRDPTFAVRLARQCVRLDGESSEAHQVLAAALAAAGKFGEAIAAIDRAMDVARAAGLPVPAEWREQRERYRLGRAWVAE